MQIHHIETPALVLDLDIFEENLLSMQRHADSVGVALRPHYKSHKCTWIAHRQIELGAKGICCAKLSEAEDLVNAGIEDILIANQITAPAKVSRAAVLAGRCKLTVCVDQPENIRALEAAAALEDTTIHILIEYEVGMNRCGVDTPEDFLALAQQVAQSPHLVFDGIQAYAGQLSHEEDYAHREAVSAQVEARIRALKDYVEQAGLPVKEISGTSTGTVQFRGKDTVYTEIQCGSYIFMDSSYRFLNLPYRNALFLLAEVISVARGKQVVLDCGMKAVSTDQHPPVLQDYPQTPLEFSEEHVTLPLDDGTLKLGDKLYLLPSHCCTTMNLYDHLYLVRGDRVVDYREIISRGKSR